MTAERFANRTLALHALSEHALAQIAARQATRLPDGYMYNAKNILELFSSFDSRVAAKVCSVLHPVTFCHRHHGLAKVLAALLPLAIVENRRVKAPKP